MVWFRVDDKLWGHPKWVACSPRARALWATAGSWSMDQLTDGKVPLHVLAILGGNKKDAGELVDRDLWHATDEGWIFHDWPDFQPTAEQVKAERKASKDRQQRARDAAKAKREAAQSSGEVTEPSRRESRRDEGVTHGVSHGPPDPTRPDPTQEESSPNGEDASPKSLALVVDQPRADVIRLCEHLASRIEDNGSKRPEVIKSWRTAARLMLDKDKRTEDQVHSAIDWCQDDEFWRANILSMPTLREKYDTLRLQAQRKSSGGGGRAAETQGILERAMVRAEAKMRGEGA